MNKKHYIFLGLLVAGVAIACTTQSLPMVMCNDCDDISDVADAFEDAYPSDQYANIDVSLIG